MSDETNRKRAKRPRKRSTNGTKVPPVTVEDQEWIGRLRDGINHFILKRGTNAKAVSLKAGLGATFVSDFLADRSSAPGMVPMFRVATALGTTLANLHGGEDDLSPSALLNQIELVAIIETGAFRDMPKGNKFPRVHAAPIKSLPGAARFAGTVKDRAMDACTTSPMTPGMEVHWIDMASADLAVESGNIYVIRRTRDGKSWEWLIRRAKVFSDRVEYHAESTIGGVWTEPIVATGKPLIDVPISQKARPKGAPIVVGLVYHWGYTNPDL